MNLDFAQILSTGLVIVTLATATGLGLTRGTVANLRDALAEERAAKAEMRAERVEDRSLIEQQKTQLEALAKVVTGEVHWLAISHLLDEHHVEARDHWTRSEGNTAKMLEELHAIREGLAR